MTSVNTQRIRPGYEPIDGYVLEKRIGRGGFGEVWRAEAPGGLKKAVKFVFGQHDERHAEQELKSLQRIKSVQHPFILTLERFEFIDNQLVIVTELADGSLEAVYKRCKQQGAVGIGRDKLLGFMRDTAEALDYLHDLYQLQHLDIKPANLLIIGGRVKVADFGLIKDLGEAECSLVNGLTPIYAPPEVFDGLPSIHSDQYSLAIMYQELLTGKRPFNGRTVAQLATQHVHNAPNLNYLSESDRMVVARALEKAPDRRFASCSAFVAELIQRDGLHPSQTTVAKVQPSGDTNNESGPNGVNDLPRLDLGNQSVAQENSVPTLIVALGGSGAECLNRMRSRIGELGSQSPLTMHSVMIDTDPLVIRSTAALDSIDSIPRTHVVPTTLRSANEYRQRGIQHLKSISRHWIYNVPRNGQTGGIRPLGRLALVDHGRSVMDALRAAVDEFKQNVHDDAGAKVYVAGSLSGGSGSGMYIDVVYLLRHLLDEAGLSKSTIVSFLTTANLDDQPAHPLAFHATKSALNELAFFLKPGNNYPGDAGVGWPGVSAARSPLHQAYLVTPSNAAGAPTTLESMVEYIWSDATVCGNWLATGRRDQESRSTSPATIRALSVIRIGDPGDQRASQFAPKLTRSLLRRWQGSPNPASSPAREFSLRIQRRCHLRSDQLSELVKTWFGKDEHDRQDKLIAHLKSIDPMLMMNFDRLQQNLLEWITGSIEVEQTRHVAEQIKSSVVHELMIRLDDGRLDLSSAVTGLSLLKQCVHSLTQEYTDQARHFTNNLRSSNDGSKIESLSEPQFTDASEGSTPFSLTAPLRLGHKISGIVSNRLAVAILTTIDRELAVIVDRYTLAGKRIKEAIEKLDAENGSDRDRKAQAGTLDNERDDDLIDALHDRVAAQHLLRLINDPLTLRIDQFISQLNTSAIETFRKLDAPPQSENHSLPRDADGDKNVGPIDCQAGKSATKAGLPDPTAVNATTFVESGSDSSLTTKPYSDVARDTSTPISIGAAIVAVRPPLLDCGGRQRLYLICRDESERKSIVDQMPDQIRAVVNPVLDRSSVATLIHEAQDIELAKVIGKLSERTPDNAKINDRMASRCDIHWS